MKNRTMHKVIKGITVLSVVFAVQAQATLIGHWAFDEGSGSTTADSSAAGNTGTIVNGATWGSDATRASYLSFDGVNQSVNPAMTLPVMTSVNDFTWAFWANSQAALSSTQQNSVIVGNRNMAGGGDFTPRQFIKFTPRQFEWHQNAVGTDNFDVADLVVGEWQHHAIVKTGTTLEYYLDGASQGTSALTGAIGSAAHPFYIGGDTVNGGGNEHFNGFVDDVRIYDNALTGTEIQALLIPEPSSLLLSLFGVVVVLAVRRRA